MEIDLSPIESRLDRLEANLRLIRSTEYVTVQEHQASQQMLLDAIANLQGEIGDLKERGVANTQRIQAMERDLTKLQNRKRTVRLTSDGVLVDEEQYGLSEPIVLDLKAVGVK